MNLKSLSLKELSAKYFPDSLPSSGSKQLKRWIIRNTDLYVELEENGYTPRQRYFTPRQVELLYLHLGEP